MSIPIQCSVCGILLVFDESIMQDEQYMCEMCYRHGNEYIDKNMAELKIDNHSFLVLGIGEDEMWEQEYYLFNEGDIDWFILPTWEMWRLSCDPRRVQK